MSMTKKDYQLVANMMNQSLWQKDNDPMTVTRVTMFLASAFEIANDKFQRQRFMEQALRDVTSQPKGENNGN